MGQQPFPVAGSPDDEPVAGAGQPVQSTVPLELDPDARAMAAAGRLIPSEPPAPRRTAGPPDPESSARRHPRSLSALVRSTEDCDPLAPAKMQLGPLSTPRGPGSGMTGPHTVWPGRTNQSGGRTMAVSCSDFRSGPPGRKALRPGNPGCLAPASVKAGPYNGVGHNGIRNQETRGHASKGGIGVGRQPVWVHPGRITAIEPAPGGAYSVTIDSTTVSFAARNLDQRGVIRDLTLWTIISNMDTGEVHYTVRLESLPVHARTGRPALVEMDEEDDHVIHLHPGALYQELYPPSILFLVCPAEPLSRWFRQ